MVNINVKISATGNEGTVGSLDGGVDAYLDNTIIHCCYMYRWSVGYSMWAEFSSYNWLRFTGITLPAGISTFSNCYLTLYAKASNTGDTARVLIEGVNQASPTAAPTTFDEYFADSTTGGTAWSFSHWSAGTGYNSPDISSIINTLYSTNGGSLSNGAMQFHLDWWYPTAYVYRDAYDYSDGNSSYYATLHIESASLTTKTFSPCLGIVSPVKKNTNKKTFVVPIGLKSIRRRTFYKIFGNQGKIFTF